MKFLFIFLCFIAPLHAGSIAFAAILIIRVCQADIAFVESHVECILNSYKFTLR